MKNSKGESSPKLDRKTVERNRRIRMNGLCFELSSLIPPQYLKRSKVMLSQQNQLDNAASYIRELKERVDKLKKARELALRPLGIETSTTRRHQTGSRLPVVRLRDLGSSIEVVLISTLNKNYLLFQVISILEEQGAEVISASFSRIGGKFFHTIHARVKISRIGVDTNMVCERLQELIN